MNRACFLLSIRERRNLHQRGLLPIVVPDALPIPRRDGVASVEPDFNLNRRFFFYDCSNLLEGVVDGVAEEEEPDACQGENRVQLVSMTELASEEPESRNSK